MAEGRIIQLAARGFEDQWYKV